jgi:hypothetical protein
MRPRREVLQSESRLVAGSRQSRSLRTAERAIAHLQRARPRSGLRWRKHHADRAIGLGSQTRRTGRRGDAEVSRRPDRDSGQRHALFVGELEHLCRAARSHLRRLERPAGGRQRDRDGARAGKRYALRTARRIVGDGDGPGPRSKLRRSEGDLN